MAAVIEGSCVNHGLGKIVHVAEPITPYRKMFGVGAADGAAIARPQSHASWGSWQKEVHQAGATTALNGRILYNDPAIAAQRIEIWGLATNSAATITLQLFGFDIAPDEPTVRSLTAYPLAEPVNTPRKGLGLGLSYGLTRNMATPADTVTLTASAAYIEKVSFINTCEPYNDETSGTLYYTSEKEVFSTLGLVGFMVYVTAISAGTAAVLGRLY